MKKWEYCQLLVAVFIAVEEEEKDRPRPAVLKFLGPSKETTKAEELDGVDTEHKVAQLGLDGWELVSHTPLWGMAQPQRSSSNVIPIPVGSCYTFKREVASDTATE